MNNKLLAFLTITLLIVNSSFAQNHHFEIAENNYQKSIEFESKNIDSSLVYIEKAYTLLKSKDTVNKMFADVLNQYGRVYFHKKKYAKAYNLFNRCYKTSLSTKNEADAYKIKVNMALCQRQLNNSKKALEDLFEVIDYFEEKDPTSINLGKTYANVADVYMLNKHHQLAETYYQKSLSFFKEDKNSYIQLQGNRIANFNGYNTDQSLEIISEIETTIQLDSLPIYISAPIYNSMSQTMVKTGDYKKGLSYSFKGLDIKKQGGLKIGIAIQYNNIGDIYLKTENYPLAITYLDSALQNAVTHRQKFQILKNLQKAEKANNNIEQSLVYANQYIALKDSLNEVLTQKEIAELGVKYGAKEKDRFIDKLENLSLLYKLIIAIVLIVAFFIVFNMLKKNKAIKTEVQLLQNELADFKEIQEKKQVATNKVIHLKNNTVLDSDTILYVKSDGHYVEYYIDSKSTPEVDRNKLSEVLKQLPAVSFVRIHNSYIVNIQRIKIINSTKVMLDNGEWINLSRTYKQQLKDILHKGD